MDASLSRVQVRLVAAFYAVVAVICAGLIAGRYLQYVRNPQDAAAAGGMYAGGDLFLVVIVCMLLLAPTAALALVIRRSEQASTTYARVLLGVSLTAPLSAVFLIIPVFNQWQWGDLCIFRLTAIPFVLAALVFSRWLIRFARARRLLSWALLAEGLTLLATFAGCLFLMR